MSDGSAWYQDEGALLSVLRQAGGPAVPVPAIPGYHDLHLLGRGGQGIVFSAVQRSTRRRVAVKVLLDGAWASESRRRRFEREIDLIAALRHPNIVRLYDSGVTEAGFPYFVMEYLDGQGLDKRLLPSPDGPGSTRPWPARRALELIAKVAEAVNYAHQRGVIHRDLKPSNIRIDSAGEPYVVDFGLAKTAPDPYATDLTGEAAMSQTGEFMGSPPWASPEQAEGRPHATDVRTDIYALGVIAFQLLTGTFPYPVTGGLHEVLEHIRHTEPRRPSSLRRELDDEVDTIVLKCLAKEPDRRYQTAAELARDLRHYLAGEPIEAKRDSALYTLRKTLRRYRTALRVSAAIAAVTLAAASLTLVLWLRAQAAEQRAEQQRREAVTARDAEQTARSVAEREAARARAINRFLVNMLSTPLDYGREARVADVLDQAAGELDAQRDLEPGTEAGLREALGNAYASLGLYEQAEPQLERAYAGWQALQGELGPETLQTRAGLAWLRRQTGRLDEAETLFRRLLEDRRRVLGDEHINTTRTMNDLAYVLELQGKLDEAESLHRQALAGVRRLLGPEALDTLTSMGNLASVLAAQGAVDEAEGLLRERLETARRVLGPNHRDTLRAAGSYAQVLGLRGRYDEAALLAGEVADANRRLLGDDHPETIVALVNLAGVLSSAGQLAPAETLLRDELARCRRVAGPAHPNTLGTLSSLGQVLNARGRYAEAEPLLLEAATTARRVFGPDHAETIYALGNLAKGLQLQGRLVEAERLYRAALAAGLRHLGADHPYTLRITLDLGAVWGQQQHFDDAELLVRRVLRLRQQRFGPQHSDTLDARVQWGLLWYRRGDFSAAAEELEHVAALLRRTLPAGHWYAAYVEGWAGRALHAAGRDAEARPHLERAARQLQTALGDDHPRTREAQEALNSLEAVP